MPLLEEQVEHLARSSLPFVYSNILYRYAFSQDETLSLFREDESL
jgi:hypothetical protein